MIIFTLTLWWAEEVEERVVGDSFGDGPDRAAALVLLFLLDCFQRYILALCPVNRATMINTRRQEETVRPASNILNVKSK